MIKVKVKPNSNKQEIDEINGIYEISLKSSAEDNKANIELIKLMKKHFNKDFKIVRGMKSKKKVLKCQ